MGAKALVERVCEGPLTPRSVTVRMLGQHDLRSRARSRLGWHSFGQQPSAAPQKVFTSPEGVGWARERLTRVLGTWVTRGQTPGWEGPLLPGTSQSLTTRVLKTDLSKFSFYRGQNRPKEGEGRVSCHAAAGSQPRGFFHPLGPEGQHPGSGKACQPPVGSQLLDPAAVFHVN